MAYDPIEEAANRIRGNLNQPGGFAGVPAPPQSTTTSMPGFYTPKMGDSGGADIFKSSIPAPPQASQTTSLPGFYTPPAPSNPVYLSSPVPAPAMRAVQPTMSNEEFQKQLPGIADGIKQRMDQPGGFAGPTAPWAQNDRPTTSLNNPVPAPAPSSAAPSSVPTSNVPAPQMPGQMSADQIRKEAEARIAKQRAALAQSVDKTKTGLKNTYDYQTGLTNDRRTLENGAFQRNNNPFSGQTDYLTANMLRDRGIQDTAVNKDFAAATGAADQQLANFDTQAPEQTDALVNELSRIERDYGLQVGQLTGNWNGQRTLAGQNADWGRVVDTANLTGNFKGGQTLAAQNQSFNQMNQNRNYDLNLRQQHVNEAKDLSERYGIQVNPTDDYQLMLDQVKGLPTTAQRTAAEKAQAQQQSDAWKAVETLGYVPPQYADIIGVPAGTETQKAKDQAMSNAIKQRQVGVSERNAATSEKNAQTNADKASQQPKPTATNINTHINSLDKMYTAYDRNTGKRTVTNPDQLERAILSLNLPHDQTSQLYEHYGLQIPQ